MRQLAFLLLLLTACSVNAAEKAIILQDREGGYSGTTDTQLAKGYNLGKWTQFGIWQYDGPALIRFDLSQIPKSAKVKAASLELFFISCGFAPQEINRNWPVEVFQCEQAWQEGTGTDAARTNDGATIETWNGKDAWPSGKVTVSLEKRLGRTVIAKGQEQRWYKWTLNETLVQKWISGEQENHGIVIAGKPPGKAVAFASRENPDPERRPILKLTLSVPDSDLPLLLAIAPAAFSWEEYVRDCGLAAQKTNQARTEDIFRWKYKDKVINWSGTVYSVAEAKVSGGFMVGVTMKPTESALGRSDVTLFATEAFKNAIIGLNKGDTIRFSARFTRQGGFFLDHQFDLMHLAK